MPTGNRQPKWDIYEAVILLDGYLVHQQGNLPKAQIIKRISAELRQMALNRGIEIDDVYRNENGISYQIQSMDSAFKGEKVYVPATKLFDDVVELYRTNHEGYLRILEEAKNMIAAKQNNKDSFLTWVASVLPPQRCKWVEENILKIEHLAVVSKMISGSIFEVTDSDTLVAIYKAAGKNKLFQIKNRKIIKYINEDFMAYVEFCSSNPEIEAPITASENVQTDIALEEKNGVVAVLKQHYEYGFKYDSIRELMRFRQFAEEMNIELPDADEDLRASILSSGTVIDDKVFCKSDDMPEELRCMIDDVFTSGANVIYYESLFEKEQEWMESHVITTPDILKEYLQKNIEGCSFSKKFMIKGSRRTEKEAVTEELKRVWGTPPSNSVNDLHNRLPYIPLGNIWRVISGNDLFVLVSEGEYLFIDRFIITEDEEKNILDFAETTCEENGFASLSDVPLGNIEEENYELTQLAIYNAIYKKVLADKFHLNGKILTKDKPDLDAITLLKQYIKDKDECSFDEVAEKVIELTGGTNRQYAFQALYDDMIRVDKNRFVANRFVNFNVDEIDAILAGFITDDFRAIRDVTTFAMFPLCGQNWNHYLLESFCYKYSKKYSLHVLNFNDKNAGIIAEKEYTPNYSEMLAIALSRTDVELATEVIGQYLCDTGYMAKSKYAKLGEIAQRAAELRKER